MMNQENEGKLSDTILTDQHAEDLKDLVRRFTNAAQPTQVIVDGIFLVNAEFARDLERKLAAANARIAELEKDEARLDWLEETEGEEDGCRFKVENSITYNGNTGCPPHFPATRKEIDRHMNR